MPLNRLLWLDTRTDGVIKAVLLGVTIAMPGGKTYVVGMGSGVSLMKSEDIIAWGYA